MRSGTRRMWSRRILRAGWLIAPIFTFPGKLVSSIKRDPANYFMFLMMAAFVGFLFFLFYSIRMTHQPASAEKIAAALSRETGVPGMRKCVLDQLQARAKIGPISNLGVSNSIEVCDDAYEAALKLAEQQKVLQ